MARSGHGTALEERRLNHGLQTLPSGLSAFPVPRGSNFHRSINQKLPELWADFSDRGLPEARSGHCDRGAGYHGDLQRPEEPVQGAAPVGRPVSLPGSSPPSAKPGKALFVGFAEFDMDGRAHTAGEMDRMMIHAAHSKYPCSRPATFDEYAENQIMGLPGKNHSGRDVVFVGPGATGCEIFHTNTLFAQKCAVPPGDPFDGHWGTAALHGRKCVLCVYPVARVRRQQSLTQFGLARSSIGGSGRLRRAGSLASMSDGTRWTTGDFAGSSSQAQRTTRMDQFFR